MRRRPIVRKRHEVGPALCNGRAEPKSGETPQELSSVAKGVPKVATALRDRSSELSGGPQHPFRPRVLCAYLCALFFLHFLISFYPFASTLLSTLNIKNAFIP